VTSADTGGAGKQISPLPAKSEFVPAAHAALLRWLLFVGAIALAIFVSFHQGWTQSALRTDSSYLSHVIFLFFVGATLYIGHAFSRLAREATRSSHARAILRTGSSAPLELSGRIVRCGDTALPEGLFQQHVMHLMERQLDAGRLAPEQGRLLEAAADQLRAPVRSGWMVADFMIKLGLLGTVVGFIFMLGALSGASDFDLATLRTLLKTMGSGMGVALYTTLFGLLAGGFTAWQVHLLENAGERLLADLTVLSETQVLPRLSAAGEARL
jgi:hypothetical protein